MEDVVFIKKGASSEKEKDFDGIKIKLLVKSGSMETLLIEMDKGADFGSHFKHRGEEYHYVIEGTVEYEIDSKTYRMEAGDSLWHKSDLSHTAKNVGDGKAVLIDVITPPSFM